MIQRIQHLYLGILAIMAIIVSFSKTTVISIAGKGVINKTVMNGANLSYSRATFIKSTNQPDVIDFAMKSQYILWAIALWAIVTIFSFKNLKRQITFSSFNFAFILFLPIFVALDLFNYMDFFIDGAISFHMSAIFPIALLLLNFMATRHIVKDFNLLKSVNRMR